MSDPFELAEEQDMAPGGMTIMQRVYDPYTDTLPGLLFGIQAIVGTVWWVLVMFISLNNDAPDGLLTTIAGLQTLPVGWWWERIGEIKGRANTLAASLLLTWLLYLIISVVELISWIMYLAGNAGLARFYFSTVGYWGSLIGYAGPWIVAIIQLVLVPQNAFPSVWATFHLIVSFVMWVGTGLVHIFFIDAFIAHVDALSGKECICTAPAVFELPPNADYEM